MRYLGGKYRLRKKIGKVLNNLHKEEQIYWEPFVGSAWVTTQIEHGPVFCSDDNEYLIAMWNALLEGWVPPEYVNEEEYYYVKEHQDEDPKLTSFVGFGCSWSGKWFGGYARDNTGRNYAKNAKNSLLKKTKKLKPLNPVFFTYDFLVRPQPFHGRNCLIYCDPPYKNTTRYGATGDWNPTKFWNIIEELNYLGHTVVVSEYTAPDNFKSVAEFPTKTDLRTKNGKENRVEKLFMLEEDCG